MPQHGQVRLCQTWPYLAVPKLWKFRVLGVLGFLGTQGKVRGFKTSCKNLCPKPPFTCWVLGVFGFFLFGVGESRKWTWAFFTFVSSFSSQIYSWALGLFVRRQELYTFRSKTPKPRRGLLPQAGLVYGLCFKIQLLVVLTADTGVGLCFSTTFGCVVDTF